MACWSLDRSKQYEYQGFNYDLDLLLHLDSIILFLVYVQQTSQKELSVENIMYGLLNGSQTFLVSRIKTIYAKIDWLAKSQDHTSFLTWLEDVFLPLLDKIRPIIPDINQLVDADLSERKPEQTLEFILTELRKHCRPSQSESSESVRMHEDS